MFERQLLSCRTVRYCKGSILIPPNLPNSWFNREIMSIFRIIWQLVVYLIRQVPFPDRYKSWRSRYGIRIVDLLRVIIRTLVVRDKCLTTHVSNCLVASIRNQIKTPIPSLRSTKDKPRLRPNFGFKPTISFPEPVLFDDILQLLFWFWETLQWCNSTHLTEESSPNSIDQKYIDNPNRNRPQGSNIEFQLYGAHLPSNLTSLLHQEAVRQCHLCNESSGSFCQYFLQLPR